MRHPANIFMRRAATAGLLLLAAATTPLHAAPVLTAVNQDLSASDYSFSFMGGTFTFSGRGGFPAYISVSTAGGAAVRTVFGNPSTDFINRGTVTYDANTLGGYAAFPTPTAIGASNGDNFLGLRVTSGGQNYYGFAYTTNRVFNGYGFETSPNTAITATPNLAAVPEPAAWAMMLVGFGLVGAAARRRQGMALA